MKSPPTLTGTASDFLCQMQPTMIEVIILDSRPLGLLSQRAGKTEADACRTWAADWQSRSVEILVPEIADYEVRRELIRAGKTEGIARLDALYPAIRYLPLTTSVMREAARLWALARNQRMQTSPPEALDGDMIVAAQAFSLGLTPAEFIVATSNPLHLSRFVPADVWENIIP